MREGSGVRVGHMTEAGTAILLTPPGGAAIAVVRLHGPAVSGFLARHFSKPATPGRPVHGTLADGDRVLDDPVVVRSNYGLFADLSLHGGPWVVQSVLDLARRAGFDVQQAPGLPLPAEAVDANSELGREVLEHLPLARTELAVRTLLAQPEQWRLLAGNVSADGARHVARWAPVIGAVLADRSLHWLLHPPRVAIVGAANVGKSTLANQLFAQERSITADLPGTTRDWVGEIADVDGLAVMLLDTPGLRETPDPIELAALEQSRREIEAADLLVVVLDATGPLPPDPWPLLASHPAAIHVMNKCDRAAAGGVTAIREFVPTVATTGEGVGRLRAAIQRHFLGEAAVRWDRPCWWTRRQRELLERAAADPRVLAGFEGTEG